MQGRSRLPGCWWDGGTRDKRTMKPDRAWSTLPIDPAMLLSVIGREPWSWRRLISRFKLHSGLFDRLVDQVPTGASVLDVGCGFGLFLGLLATSNRKIRGSGFDRNAASICRARDMASRLETMGCPADLRFECRDINDPWPVDRFDVVTIIDVLHHLRTALRPGLLAEASARLRPGGLVVVKDISPRRSGVPMPTGSPT